MEFNANHLPAVGLNILKAGMNHFSDNEKYILGFTDYLVRIGDPRNALGLLQKSLEGNNKEMKPALWEKIIQLHARFGVNEKITTVLGLEEQFRSQFSLDTNPEILQDVSRYVLWGVCIVLVCHVVQNHVFG